MTGSIIKNNLIVAQLRTLLTASAAGAVGHSVFVALALIAVSYSNKFDILLGIYTLVIVTFSILRFLGSRNLEKIISKSDLQKEKNKFDLLILVISATWALFFARIWSIPNISIANLSLVQFSVCGLLGAASSSLGCSKKSYYAFIFPILIGVSVHGFMYYDGMGSLIVQQSVYLIFTGFVLKVQIDQEKLWFENYSQREELELILQSFPFGVSVIDNETYHYVNQNVVEQVGHQQESFKGKHFGFLGFETDYIKSINDFILSSEDRYVGEISMYSRLNQKNMVHMIVLQKLTTSKKMVCLTINVDDKKAVEVALQEQIAKSMASAKMASLGEMAAGLAHEINNPLTIITGMSHLLIKIMKKENLAHAKLTEGLIKIESTSHRIASIIKGLRTFARDAENDTFAVVNVNNLINDTLAFCRSKFEFCNVKLEILNSIQDISIECRETEISQVVLNLLNNALDAVEKLPQKWVKVEVEVKNEIVIISVIDSGHGVPLEIQEKIMQPFFTTKEVGKGTGLGLSISIGIAKAHKGLLIIDRSHPNTKFSLQLPMQQAVVIKSAS
ncbi:MAG: ATP-binding protein [Pseudobdellovibrio sp.]